MGTKPKSEPLWNRYYVIMIFLNLLVGLTNFMLSATLPAYVLKIGADTTAAGLIIGVFSLAALVVRPLFGRISDQSTRQLTLLIGALIMIGSSVLYSFAASVPLLLAIRALHGFGFSAYTTAAGAVVADIVPTSRLSEGIGIYGISNTVATALGPALGIYLAGYGDQPVFLAVLGCSLLGLGGAWTLDYEKTRPQLRKRSPQLVSADGPGKAAPGFFEKTSVAPSLVAFFVAVSMGGIMTFIPLLGTARHIEGIGVFFTVYAGAILVTRLVVGRVADRVGVTRVMVPGVLLTVTAYGILAWAPSLGWVLVAAVLYGLGGGIVWPLLNTALIRLCPPERRGAANATYYCFMDIGVTIGAVVCGLMVQYFGYGWMYGSSAVVMTVSGAMYFALLRGKLKARGTQGAGPATVQEG